MLHHKIPPPLVTLATVGAIYGTSRLEALAALDFPSQTIAAIAVAVLGLSVMLSGALEFRRAKTTVNPLSPEQASELVISGVFRFTRNPMYLGMGCIIAGFTLWIGNGVGLFWLTLFVLYIQVFQISPEEMAMEKLFGEQFVSYRQKVRRWV